MAADILPSSHASIQHLLKGPLSLTLLIALLLARCASGIQCHNEVHGRPPSPIELDVIINPQQVKNNINHFWESTGFCPPDPHQSACEWFLSDDMRQNIAFMGSIPNAGLKQVRIHWLLDAVYVARLENNQVSFNFTCLDKFIQVLWQNGLSPGFELMGNPSNVFTDFENGTQVDWWADLVEAAVSRFTDEYGLGYVSKWNIETWNEPENNHFDGLNFTLQGFLNYYDACVEGLHRVSSSLRLGGPGGECHTYDPSKFCWALLNHTANGRSYFEGKKSKMLDFISIHKKGEIPNNTQAIMQKENEFLKTLLQHFPSLAHIPIHNNEADPIVTWSKSYSFRSDSTYAAMITKIILAHQENFPQIQLLSNDNGFLSYKPFEFSQRTLLARFQINATTGRQVQFIRKPVYSVLALLSLIGDQEVKTLIKGKDSKLATIDALGTIHKASEHNLQDSWQLTAVVCLSADTHNYSVKSFNISFRAIVPEEHLDVMYTAHLLDHSHGNPSTIWEEAHSPHSPNQKLLKLMRSHEEPVRVITPTRFNPEKFSEHVVAQMPGVVLMHFCAKASQGPDQVNGLFFYNITKAEVLITWSDHCIHTKCIKTFEVEFSRSGSEESFHLINPVHTIFTSFVFVLQDESNTDMHDPVEGFYRVGAIDYWNRASEYSLIGKYPS